MKTKVRKNLQRLVSLMIAVCMCLSLVPPKAEAWKILSHVNSADIILLELQRSARQNGGQAKVTIKIPDGSGESYSYNLPSEYQEAILSYPDAFRAGSMGPDIYPDLMTGQGYIHPLFDVEDKKTKQVLYQVSSGEWIPLLCNSLNMLPKNSAKRKEALSFTLGFMLHYCGDMFGHDFINSFAGGTYPDLDKVDYLNGKDPNLNIILSHSAEESFMDEQVNTDFYKRYGYLGISAPLQFIKDTLVYNGDVNNGVTRIFPDRYRELPALYNYLIDLRTKLYNTAESWRPSCEVAHTTAVKYLDAWIADLDKATEELIKCFDKIGSRMLTEPDNTFGIVKEEILDNWFKNYGKYITPAPDIAIDGIFDLSKLKDALNEILAAIGLDSFIKDIEKWMQEQVVNIALSALGLTGLQEAIKDYKNRFSEAEEQLDHKDNPFKPSKNNYEEYKNYIDLYADEQELLGKYSLDQILNGRDNGALDNAIDSDFEAFYNTMVMFKLILMGPENFTSFVKTLSGVNQTQFKKNTGNIVATSLEVQVNTSDMPNAGTDDNIYVEVYKTNNEFVTKKVLDKSSYNDFERGDTDTYTVELKQPVRVDQLKVYIKKESTGTGSPDWDCGFVKITPIHAGVKLMDAIDFGGRHGMKNDQRWDLHFNEEINLRLNGFRDAIVQRVDVRIHTKDSAGSGTDADISLVVSNGSETKKYLLDKANYNDFEKNDDDTYMVFLSSKDMPVTRLSNIKLGLNHSDKDDDWTFDKVTVRLYNGGFQLADEIVINEGHELTDEKNETDWDMNIGSKIRNPKTKSAISLSYQTDVDGGLVSNIKSLDDSRQWKDGSGILWNNETVRSKVFLKIFKGFAPDITVSGTKEIFYADKFDMDISFEGVWNGVTKSRRDKVPNSPAMPAVEGSAKISFLDKNGTEMCSTTQNVNNGKIELRGYAYRELIPGTYSVRVAFTAKTSNQQYSDTVKTFENVLSVKPKDKYTVSFRVSGGTWNDGTTEDKTVVLNGTALSRYLSSSQIPAVGDYPAEHHKEGSWNIAPTTSTEIKGDTTFTFTYSTMSIRTSRLRLSVVNGKWNDGSVADRYVTLRAYEDEQLLLSPNQIPAVGNKPNAGYKEGSWSIPIDGEMPVSSGLFSTKYIYYTYQRKQNVSNTVTFKVVNGSWDDGTTEDKTVSIVGLEGDPVYLNASNIPAVGTKPNDEYKEGTWDVVPAASTPITGDTTFTYTYADDKTIYRTVNFKVENGTWDDGTTEDKTVTLSGKQDDTFKLSADQIPAVGTKPADTYKTGAWKTTPDTETAITEDTTTYTYSYAARESISCKVTFKVVNGKWDDGSTADKTVTLTGLEGDFLVLSEDQIPAVGTKPQNNTFKEGEWNITPDTQTAVTENTTFTYTYAEKAPVSQTVTFKVVNGKWDDGTTENKTVKLEGLEGDTLKLSADSIPEVGFKPNNTFKAGEWDVAPVADTEITQDTVYTYTFVKKEPISYQVTFKVENGSWNDGTTEDKTVTLSGLEGDYLKLAADNIPAAGTKPADTYKEGAWDTTPDTETTINAETTYTYTYIPKEIISQTVTFKVVNGTWDDGTVKDKTVKLEGLEGDTLKLSANDIPDVGLKPDDTYKAGAWNIAPSTDSEIVKDTVYTYTYAAKDAISKEVTFKVVNGTWDDGTSADKIVTVFGLEGDTLKLASDQIPEVGAKPFDAYKAGTWDFVPDTETEITDETVYTYSYVEKDKIIVQFDTEGGSQVSAVTVYSGDTLEEPKSPERTSYVFAGWYADEEHTVPFDFTAAVTADTVVYAAWEAVVYTADGDAQHKEGSTDDVVIVVKRSHADETCFSHFTGVEIDGKLLVNGTDYTAVAGSTVITLKASALNKLSAGAHTVTILFDDGMTQVRLAQNAKDIITNNGDNNPPRTGAAAAGMGILALAAAAIVMSKKKK